MTRRKKSTTALSHELRLLFPVLKELTSWLNERVIAPPAPTSLMAKEIDEEALSARPGLATSMSKSTHEAIGLLTWSASGHLDGLRRLLGAKDEVPHPHALVSLARGAVENAALGGWLADASIEGDERRRRFASYQHHGLREYEKLGLGPNTRGEIDCLESAAHKSGWKLVVPTKTDLAAELFKDKEVGSNEAFGAFGYRVQSAIAHGSFHSLAEFFISDGNGQGQIGATGPQAFSMCILPAVCALQLLGYQLVDTLGIDSQAWRDLIKRGQEPDVSHLWPRV